MTAADRAKALRDRKAKTDAEEAPPPPRPARTKPVRQTVDLTPDQHAALGVWRLETALALGLGRLSTQDILSAAVAVLVEDETVGRRVRARLERDAQ